MADPVLNRRTQVQYRRKAPCEIRRDQERAEKQRQRQQQQQQLQQADSRRDSTSDISTPYLCDSQCQQTTGTQNYEAQHTTSARSKHSEVHGSVEDDSNILHVLDSVNDLCEAECAVNLDHQPINFDTNPTSTEKLKDPETAAAAFKEKIGGRFAAHNLLQDDIN
ncbi:hypothetical protein ACOMHN_008052 [Nucella lapillus]